MNAGFIYVHIFFIFFLNRFPISKDVIPNSFRKRWQRREEQVLKGRLRTCNVKRSNHTCSRREGAFVARTLFESKTQTQNVRSSFYICFPSNLFSFRCKNCMLSQAECPGVGGSSGGDGDGGDGAGSVKATPPKQPTVDEVDEGLRKRAVRSTRNLLNTPSLQATHRTFACPLFVTACGSRVIAIC